MSIPKWRETLKRRLLARDSVCRGCGEPYGIPHMHEGIISRGQAMGLPKRKRIRIYDSRNCVLLCPSCNLGLGGKSAPDRQKVWDEHVVMYGGDAMNEWYESMRGLFKSRLPRYD